MEQAIVVTPFTVILIDGTLGGRFTHINGWATENGKLPGLFGMAVNMPEYIINGPPTPPSDAIIFKDSNFAKEVMKALNTSNLFITASEVAAITELNLYNKKITDMNELRYFTSIEYLVCTDNDLTELDISKNPSLKYSACGNTGLTSLDISKNPLLEELYCSTNKLMVLDVRSNTMLKQLNCSDTQLTELDVTNNIALKRLDCERNQLITLDLSNNAILEYLYCRNNYFPDKSAIVGLDEEKTQVYFDSQNGYTVTFKRQRDEGTSSGYATKIIGIGRRVIIHDLCDLSGLSDFALR